MAKQSISFSRVSVLKDPARFERLASAAVATGKLSAADAQAADAYLSNARPGQVNLVDSGLCMRISNALKR